MTITVAVSDGESKVRRQVLLSCMSGHIAWIGWIPCKLTDCLACEVVLSAVLRISVAVSDGVSEVRRHVLQSCMFGLIDWIGWILCKLIDCLAYEVVLSAVLTISVAVSDGVSNVRRQVLQSCVWSYCLDWLDYVQINWLPNMWGDVVWSTDNFFAVSNALACDLCQY